MNAKRPSIPVDASKDTANTNRGKQPHDNMAPFGPPAPVKNAQDGGSHMRSANVAYLDDEATGTGRK